MKGIRTFSIVSGLDQLMTAEIKSLSPVDILHIIGRPNVRYPWLSCFPCIIEGVTCSASASATCSPVVSLKNLLTRF